MSFYEEKKNTLISIARKGFFEVNRLVLLPSVFRRLSKEGLTLTKIETQKGGRDKVFVSHVSWKNAYKDEVPLAVSEFISGKTKICPESEIQNFAQQLFVLASIAKK